MSLKQGHWAHGGVPICFLLYTDLVDEERNWPGPPIPEDYGFTPVTWGWTPRPEPWGQIQALGAILQGIALLPEQHRARQELYDVARRALETAVEELGDGVQLVAKEAKHI